MKAGKVSITSPTARALIGKKVGDSVEVNTPAGCCAGGLGWFQPWDKFHRSSMPEMPYPGEHHGQPQLVGCGNHFLVLDRATGLDHCGCAGGRYGFKPVREREKRIGSSNASHQREHRLHRAKPCGVHPAHLSRANADRLPVARIHNGVRLHVLAHAPGEQQTAQLLRRGWPFELSGVPVGPQTIRVRKPGYFDRPYATEDVGYQGDGPAHNVLVAAEMPDLDFALSPTSAIHGHVELSTGDAGQGITLTFPQAGGVYGWAVWAQNGTTKTNGEGRLLFALALPGGVYALYTSSS